MAPAGYRATVALAPCPSFLSPLARLAAFGEEEPTVAARFRTAVAAAEQLLHDARSAS